MRRSSFDPSLQRSRETPDYEIHRDDDLVTTVALSGPLDVADGPAIRGVLLGCLAECPAAVVVDLSAAEPGDDSALLVIAAALREAESFPPVPLLLAGAGGDLTAPLDRLGTTGHARWYPSYTAACTAATAPEALAGRLSIRLAPDKSAPAQGRELVDRACQTWALPGIAPAAQVIVSELCANAVLHGEPPFRLILLRDGGRMHIVIRDASGVMPQLRPLPDDGQPRASGNGMHLVKAFASSWAAVPTAGGGKAVWAVPHDRDDVPGGPGDRLE